jgi:hypothetical protein
MIQTELRGTGWGWWVSMSLKMQLTPPRLELGAKSLGTKPSEIMMSDMQSSADPSRNLYFGLSVIELLARINAFQLKPQVQMIDLISASQLPVDDISTCLRSFFMAQR